MNTFKLVNLTSRKWFWNGKIIFELSTSVFIKYYFKGSRSSSTAHTRAQGADSWGRSNSQ